MFLRPFIFLSYFLGILVYYFPCSISGITLTSLLFLSPKYPKQLVLNLTFSLPSNTFLFRFKLLVLISYFVCSGLWEQCFPLSPCCPPETPTSPCAFISNLPTVIYSTRGSKPKCSVNKQNARVAA